MNIDKPLETDSYAEYKDLYLKAYGKIEVAKPSECNHHWVEYNDSYGGRGSSWTEFCANCKATRYASRSYTTHYSEPIPAK